MSGHNGPEKSPSGVKQSHDPSNKPHIALLQMPGTIAHMPSIQLATLDAHLRAHGLSSDRFEYYLDFAQRIVPALYAYLVNNDHFLFEWLFTRHYFGHETGDWLEAFEVERPKLELPDMTHEKDIVSGIKETVLSFIDDCAVAENWGRYDIVAFSLTTQQLGSSIALARMIKLAYPTVKIVFGGSMCADDAGGAIIDFCPYVDVCVRVEGELIFTNLVSALMKSNWRQELASLPGISFKSQDGVTLNTDPPILFEPGRERPFINYDSYFQRLDDLDLRQSLEPMMAIESSRGCWWGEISQCSFCGLHEIMTYRTRPADFVLGEMEHLAERHNCTRFFAVDLIAPKNFFATFFPEIKKRGHNWNVFYEVKASMRREEFEIYAKSGGKIVQPGIESLNPKSLKRMHKGVHVLQNIQFLKWCTEFGVTVYWNYLVRLPGEEAGDYEGAADRATRIHHLMPPARLRDVAVVRFAPYHKTPEKYGIDALVVHRFYDKIMPIGAEILERLAFYFNIQKKTMSTATDTAIAELDDALQNWKAAFKRGAILEGEESEEGRLIIADTRYAAEPTYHNLDEEECKLYKALDGPVLDYRLAKILGDLSDTTSDKDYGSSWIMQTLQEWEEKRLILREGKQVIALAIIRERGPSEGVRRQTRTAVDAVTKPRKTRFFADD